MSDEIKKAAEQAKILGIYETVRNIASSGKNADEACDSVWESCIVVFECPNGEPLTKTKSPVRTTVVRKVVFETKITMPNGTILYRALNKGQVITDFRYGAWVERITAYSEQVTIEMQRKAESKVQIESEAKLKPFSGVDF